MGQLPAIVLVLLATNLSATEPGAWVDTYQNGQQGSYLHPHSNAHPICSLEIEIEIDLENDQLEIDYHVVNPNHPVEFTIGEEVISLEPGGASDTELIGDEVTKEGPVVIAQYAPDKNCDGSPIKIADHMGRQLVEKVYQEILGRTPKQGEYPSDWYHRGMKERKVFVLKLIKSRESLNRAAGTFIYTFLKRQDEPYRKLLADNRGSFREILAEILGSQVYYDRAGGKPEAYVTQLFNDLLDREPSAGEIGLFSSKIEAGIPRPVIVGFMLANREYRHRLVEHWWKQFSKRDAKSDEIDEGVEHLNRGKTWEWVLAEILASLTGGIDAKDSK